MNESAAQALIDGYRRGGGVLPRLDLGIFQAAAAAWLHYLYFQAQAALSSSEVQQRGHLERMVAHMLNHPPALADLKRLLVGANRSQLEVGAHASAVAIRDDREG
jgi:hypothetical protein